MTPLRGLSAVLLGALAFSLSGALLVIFFTAISCVIVGKDFTESAVGRLVFNRAAFLEQLFRAPFSLVITGVQAAARLFSSSFSGFISFVNALTDLLRFFLIDWWVATAHSNWKTGVWQELPSLLLEAAVWALAVEVVLILLYLRFGHRFKRLISRQWWPGVRQQSEAEEDEGGSLPSFSFFPWSFGCKSDQTFAELFLMKQEEINGRFRPKSPKRENTPVDSSDEDTPPGFTAYDTMMYDSEEDDEEVHRHPHYHKGSSSSSLLLSPGACRRFSRCAYAPCSSEAESDQQKESDETDSEFAGTQRTSQDGGLHGQARVSSGKLVRKLFNAFVANNEETAVNSSDGDDGDAALISSTTPAREGVELEDVNGWLRRRRPRQRNAVNMLVPATNDPAEPRVCAPSDSEPSCYEMEEFPAGFPGSPPPEAFLFSGERSNGEAEDDASLAGGCAAEDEECETEEDAEWCIIADQLPKAAESTQQ
ncbi:hypothetical protein, conserved [Eimeria acervulina]|uniref:Transmembrane protein n=1 Tax=Eimeria acervulina TaxID=5801 RepID=U6GNZ8_EIMAC|nr:hypothetical protein, conserved [Eimeria acervulina]CDI80993.1 hypothetical protein, conserved [Eimeria acervulina]